MGPQGSAPSVILLSDAKFLLHFVAKITVRRQAIVVNRYLAPWLTGVAEFFPERRLARRKVEFFERFKPG